MSDWRPTCGQFAEVPGATGFVRCLLGKFGGTPALSRCDRDCDLNPARGTRPAPQVVQVHVPTPEELAEAEKRQKKRIELFHRLWDTLHRKSLAGTLTEAALDEVAKQLPCGPCKPHFAALRAATDGPITFEDTVGWHNTVNVQEGKPLMTVDEARKLYS
jgi:hypothetical protein